MEIPPIINQMIRKRLRKRVLDNYTQYGRGCWVTTEKKGGLATYAPLRGLNNLFGDRHWLDYEELIEIVNTYNPIRQMVVTFNSEPNIYHIAIVDIEESDTK